MSISLGLLGVLIVAITIVLVVYLPPKVKRESIEAQERYVQQFQAANENYPGLYDADVAREQAKLDAMLARK
jgi:hypothetical protein